MSEIKTNETQALIKWVQNHPFSYTGQKTDEEFNAKRKELTQHLLEEDEKYSEKIYAIPAYMLDEHGINNSLYQRPLASLTGEHGMFEVHERAFLEYNPQYLQVVTVGLIKTSDDKYILLQTKEDADTRITGAITMPQGHAAFDPNHFTLALQGMIVKELQRELSEEINGTGVLQSGSLLCIDRNQELTIGSIRCYENLISLEHIGVLVCVDIPYTTEYLQEVWQLSTGESEKHDVIYMDRHELQSNIAFADDWLKMVFNDYINV